MWKLLENEWVRRFGRIESIGAFGSMLWGAMSGLWKLTDHFGQIAWPEAILLGLATALAVLLVMAACAVAWRYFRPLPVHQAAQRASGDEPEARPQEESGDKIAIVGTVSDPPRFNRHGLYGGHVSVAPSREYGLLRISIECFNATHRELVGPTVLGSILFTGLGEDSKQEIEATELPLPVARARDNGVRFYAYKDFGIIIEQALPIKIASFNRTGIAA